MNTFRWSILFVLFAAIFFISCENDMKEVNEITRKPGPQAGEVVKQLDVVYTDSGQVKMHLMAPVMRHYNINIKDPYEEFTEGVFIEFYNDKGEVKSTLKARFALRYDQSKKMEARDSVDVVNEKGERLKTNHLVWNEETRKIKTNGYVMITTPRETLYGKDGMEANEDFSEWEIFGPIGKAQFEEAQDSTTKRSE